MSRGGDDAQGSPPGYRTLEAATLRRYLAGLEAIAARLGGRPEGWQVREVGDGNLNLVFLVEGPHGSVCVKQALPYVRVAGPSWPMPPERAFFEQAYYAAVAPHVGARIPAVHHYDPELFCIVMERLAPHIILRQGLIGGRCYPNIGRDVGEYVARAAFFTSDLAVPFERKMEGVRRFAANTPLIRITVDLIFTDPYIESPRNRHTTPELDARVEALRADVELGLAAARLGRKFLCDAQALVHGDLHSGSVMVTASDTRVIDPEFAFYGPIGFDLGAFLGNLFLSWYSQPGHARQRGERVAYQAWILEQAQLFWETFRGCFAQLWREESAGDVYPGRLFAAPSAAGVLERERERFLDALFADMLGYAACKMIRRIVGFAHVADFERIADAELRARCETGALDLAQLLLKGAERFGSIGEVLEAVPRAALV